MKSSQASGSPFSSATGRASFANRPPDRPSRLGKRREEVVALVVDDDKGGEIDDLDAPDRFHPDFLVSEQLALPDAIRRQPRRRPADRAEIKSAILLARLAHL